MFVASSEGFWPIISNLIFRLGTGTGDNYSYLIIDDKTKDTMIVDPAHPPEYVWNEVWERYHAN